MIHIKMIIMYNNEMKIILPVQTVIDIICNNLLFMIKYMYCIYIQINNTYLFVEFKITLNDNVKIISCLLFSNTIYK